MNPMPSAPPPVTEPMSGRPRMRSLLRWGALVLLMHLAALLGLAGPLDWSWSSPQTLRTGPMQTRSIEASAPAAASTTMPPHNAPAARTRIAMVM